MGNSGFARDIRIKMRCHLWMCNAQIEYKICDDVETIRNKGYTILPILEIDNTPYEFGNAVKWVNERINNEH